MEVACILYTKLLTPTFTLGSSLDDEHKSCGSPCGAHRLSEVWQFQTHSSSGAHKDAYDRNSALKEILSLSV